MIVAPVVAALVALATAAPVMNQRFVGVPSADGATVEYRGIRYASAVRWAPPTLEPLPPGGEFDSFGPWCPQPDRPDGPQDEDCLFLNVVAPAGVGAGDALPVMVFFHGGNFKTGTGGIDIYTGVGIAQRKPVVVVSINYRLGALGFFAHPDGLTGNYGLMDMETALQWVRANIAEFGGNPSSVLIFGESAGGHAVCDLIASPRVDPSLYHAAIMQSGRCSTDYPSLAYMQAAGTRMAAKFDCSGASEVACLRNVDADALVNAFVWPLYFSPDPSPDNAVRWAPVVAADGWLPMQPDDLIVANATGLPDAMIIGANRDEGTIFVLDEAGINMSDDDFTTAIVNFAGADALPVVERLYPADQYANAFGRLSAAFGHWRYACPAHRQAARLTAEGVRVFVYFYEIEVPLLGAAHAGELPYVFNAGFLQGEGREVAEALGDYWAGLAAALDGPGGNWPLFTPAEGRLLRIKYPIEEGAVYRDELAEQCELWDALLAGPPADP